MGLLSCFIAMLFHMSYLIDPGSTNYCSILDVSQKHTLYFVLVLGLRGSASLAYPHLSHIQESKEVTGTGTRQWTAQNQKINTDWGRLSTFSHRILFGSSKKPFKRSLLSEPQTLQKRGFRAHTSNFPGQFLPKLSCRFPKSDQKRGQPPKRAFW